jgi:CheY-like chemotaxis protein
MSTVLVVDDEKSIRRALRGYFERSGFAVLEAGSGAEALRWSKRATWMRWSATVLMRVGGVAFYDSLVSRVPELLHRVVFLTGATRDPRSMRRSSSAACH